MGGTDQQNAKYSSGCEILSPILIKKKVCLCFAALSSKGLDQDH